MTAENQNKLLAHVPMGVHLSQIARKNIPTASRRVEKLSRDRVRRKNETGTWLSPIEQPNPASATASAPKPPSDGQHRRFIASAAHHLEEITAENATHFGEPLSSTFESYPLLPGNNAKKPDAECVRRSVNNCPLHIPSEILPQTVQSSVTREKHSSEILAGSMRYAWLERGSLLQNTVVHQGIYTYQVRHHSKLEPFHEMRRPVYCINLKTDYGDLLDLRVVALVNTEMPFLNAAAANFARKGDAFNGLPVVDHAGRLLVDERVIRRAAYHYADYQRSLFERAKETSAKHEILSFTQPPANTPDHIRYAHFLVFRSHLPELNFDKKNGSYALSIHNQDQVLEPLIQVHSVDSGQVHSTSSGQAGGVG